MQCYRVKEAFTLIFNGFESDDLVDEISNKLSFTSERNCIVSNFYREINTEIFEIPENTERSKVEV